MHSSALGSAQLSTENKVEGQTEKWNYKHRHSSKSSMKPELKWRKYGSSTKQQCLLFRKDTDQNFVND